MENKTALLEKYFDHYEKTTGRRAKSWRQHLTYFYGDLDFEKKNVLEIGGGAGVMSTYAACSGASRVVCLEPEADGSRNGFIQSFKDSQAALGLGKTVELIPQTLQEYSKPGDLFDIILMFATINHLDERACINLQNDAKSRETYKTIFEKLGEFCKPNAKLIITDCSRYNFFPFCRLRNLFMPTVEWYKHQSPDFWANLLLESGFEDPHIRWIADRYGSLGRIFLSSKFTSYFFTSYFYLLMKRA